MVLGAHVRLDALAILASGAAVDVLSGAVAANEGDGLDVLVVTDKVDAIVGAVNNVQATGWKTGLQHELDESLTGTGDALRGLQDVRVAAHQSNGVHPQGNHGREVERGNTGTNTKWLTEGFDVQIRRHALQSFT